MAARVSPLLPVQSLPKRTTQVMRIDTAIARLEILVTIRFFPLRLTTIQAFYAVYIHQ
jgi:hypothetical protein